MKALSVQPLSAMSVSQALNRARSVPGLMARCMTRSLPASTSQALTVTVRRGSTMMMRDGSIGPRNRTPLFSCHGGAAQIRHPVIEEIVCLRFERVGADSDYGVGKLGILVAVVQFAHAHIPGCMDFGVVGRPVVNADVLDLHGPEIQLAGAPGVLVAAAGAAVVESRDEQPVLAHVVDDPTVTRATRSSASSQLVGCICP